MLLDYHMHTHLTDGTGVPADYARVALARGVAEICCTDHAPLANRDTDWTMKKSDLASYVGLVRDAQRRFPDFPIKLGLEVDYIPGHEDWIRELAGLYPWDFLLGSVHYLGDFPVDRSRDDWQGQDVDARWREYFAVWKQAAASGLFDSLAHPDLPKKFNFRPSSDFTGIFDDALRTVAGKGVAIEVSTAGLRKPCREIYPSLAFLRTANRHGIPVTLGSDAHIPEDCGLDFDKAVTHLRAAGYSQIARYSLRRRELVSL
jgi:histidinol-phosphatase (PHP family)